MNRIHKIIYWITTAWLALGMISTGLVQVLRLKTETDFAAGLHYPSYFLSIIGIWKILGAITVLLPGLRLLKEWAYAGFFFVMSGAAVSHIICGTVNDIFPCLLLLALTILSWYFRPANRKIILASFSS